MRYEDCFFTLATEHNNEYRGRILGLFSEGNKSM